jgi:hypothetical protein
METYLRLMFLKWLFKLKRGAVRLVS